MGSHCRTKLLCLSQFSLVDVIGEEKNEWFSPEVALPLPMGMVSLNHLRLFRIVVLGEKTFLIWRTSTFPVPTRGPLCFTVIHTARSFQGKTPGSWVLAYSRVHRRIFTVLVGQMLLPAPYTHVIHVYCVHVLCISQERIRDILIHFMLL
jgi:hypothetical protein